jgi:ribosome modulation factor
MSSKAHETAERKGYEAALRGEPAMSCPYQDIRTGGFNHIVTWSRGFINAWLRGWEKGRQEREEAIKVGY